MTQVIIPGHSKKQPKNQAQHWMFTASAISFLMATIYEVALLATTGILIHTGLVGYQGLSLLEKLSLVDSQFVKPNLLLSWTSSFEVRVLSLD